MGVPPRRRDAAATRAAILDAAARAFAERGYTAVTVRDVARAAAVDPALVLRYFGSKAQLFAEGLSAGGADLAEVLAPPAAGLPDRIADHFAGKAGDPTLAMLVLSVSDREGRALLAQLVRQHLEQPLAATLAADGVDPADAAARARAVTTVLVGQSLAIAVLGTGPDAPRLAALLRAALAEPGAAS